jgi:hypothetical protein
VRDRINECRLVLCSGGFISHSHIWRYFRMAGVSRQTKHGMGATPDGGLNRTDLALIARGVPSKKAVKLRQSGYTISKLKQMNDAALRKLGLKSLAIRNINGGGRPPIPTPNLISVLHANRFMCCICRNPKRGIIVHHIEPWKNSKSHNPKNLSVFCGIHHEQAHTKSELTRNLDQQTLRGLKEAWEEEVQKMDTSPY